MDASEGAALTKPKWKNTFMHLIAVWVAEQIRDGGPQATHRVATTKASELLTSLPKEMAVLKVVMKPKDPPANKP